MSLNYYKNETERVCKSKGWDRAPVDTVWLLLSEEVGELASAIRQYKKMYKKTNLKKDRGTDVCLLYTSPSPRDRTRSRMPSSA